MVGLDGEGRLAETKDTKRLQADYLPVCRQVQAACQVLIKPDSIPQCAPSVDQVELQKLRVELINAVARLDALLGGEET